MGVFLALLVFVFILTESLNFPIDFITKIISLIIIWTNINQSNIYTKNYEQIL
jgi:hypothetical protein